MNGPAHNHGAWLDLTVGVTVMCFPRDARFAHTYRIPWDACFPAHTVYITTDLCFSLVIYLTYRNFNLLANQYNLLSQLEEQ